MYYIKFKDPITDLVVESRSASLAEAVALIQKARDDLYYKGNQTSLEGAAEADDEISNESDHTKEENMTSQSIPCESHENHEEYEDAEYDHYNNFFWYP